MTPRAQALRDGAIVAQMDALRAEVRRLSRIIDEAPAGIPVPAIGVLVMAAAAEFGVTQRAILGPQRAAEFVLARQVVMHLASTRLNRSMPVIGRCLNRDHTTVLHGSRVMARRIAADPDLAERVARVAAAIEPPLETRA